MTMLRSLLLSVILLGPASAIASPVDQLAVGMTEQQVLQIMKAAEKSYWGYLLDTCGEKTPQGGWTCKELRFRPPFFSWDTNEIDVWFEQKAVDDWRVHSWEEAPIYDPDR